MSLKTPVNKSYRLDIQALRAIAVLAIVIFHINSAILPGGFIGVDIFFVISGYLIIGHIWRDLNKGSFSLMNFYARRIKRLFPALIAMLSVTSIAAYFLLIPEETTVYAKSLIATVLYFSNFFFYSQSDYFNADLEMSPLLHTWSLAVEEQFYFIFPIILMFVFIRNPKKFLPVLIGIAIVSFIASELLLYKDQSLSFYASPTRFFQFIIGGIIFYIEKNNKLSTMLNECIRLVCLLVILGCLFFYSSSTPFPGVTALIPTFATALLIYSGKQQGIIYHVMSNKISEFFGRISYSTYLWHWPIIAFYKGNWSPVFSKNEQIALFVASIVLGYLSWKYIENTARQQSRNSGLRPILISLAICSFFTIGSFFSLDGLPGRYTPNQLVYSKYATYRSDVNRVGVCFLTSNYDNFNIFNSDECISHNENSKNILLIGDSHSAHFYSSLEASKSDRVTISQVNASGCKPTIAYVGIKRCTSMMKWAFEELVIDKHFDSIILSARWLAEDLPSLKKTIAELSQYVDSVFVFGPIIEYEQGLARLLAKDFINGKEGALIQESRKYEEIQIINSLFEDGLADTNAQYIAILNYICPSKNNCQVVTSTGIPMQADYGHLTHQGAMSLLNEIKAKESL